MDDREYKELYKLSPESEFFGIYVIYTNPQEKIEAAIYLDLWKKFFLIRNKNMKLISEKIIERENVYSENMTGINGERVSTLGIKIETKII